MLLQDPWFPDLKHAVEDPDPTRRLDVVDRELVDSEAGSE